MRFEVTFRHLTPRPDLRDRANELYGRLAHFLDPAARGMLIVDASNGRARAELLVATGGETHKSVGEAGELRAAVDAAFHGIVDPLRRHKERRKDHGRGRTAPSSF